MHMGKAQQAQAIAPHGTDVQKAPDMTSTSDGKSQMLQISQHSDLHSGREPWQHCPAQR